MDRESYTSQNADVVLVFNVSFVGRDTFKNITYIEEINALGAEFLSLIDDVIDTALSEQIWSILKM